MAEEKISSPHKLPPQNIEAEISLLGSLMMDKDAFLKVGDFLETRDFYKTSHQRIYQAMQELFEKGEPIDVLSVAARLKEKGRLQEVGGNAYLTELINSVPTASHVMAYAKIVQKKRILRDLISVSQEIGNMGYQESEDTDLLLDKAESSIFAIAQKSLAQNFTKVKDSLEEAFERIDRLSKHEKGTRGVPTGFADLDNILSGLQKSDLIILAARPSLGKSALATDIARRVAIHQNIPVGMFSLEMSKDQVIDRLIASQAGVDLWKLRTGRLSSQGDDNDFTRIQEAMGVLSEAPLFIEDSSLQNILKMRAMARRLQANQGLELLIIDYLQLIEPRNPQTPLVQQVSEISRSLKGLARELDIPVLALSQLSRAVEQRTPQRPRLSDLRESGCVAGDTLIIRADTGERVSIKTLADRKEQIPIPVFAVDEEYKVKTHTMTKVFTSGRKKVFELKTRSGRKIKASGNHPFLRIDGWSTLDKLKLGDSIALPRILSSQNPSNPLSDDELVLLAHLLGDGCILPQRPFHYTSADTENIETVRSVAGKLFGITGRIVPQENWYHVYLPSPYHLTHRTHCPITNWFGKLGIDLVRSFDKKIPEAVFQCGQAKIALFLSHLWATDGNVSWKKLPKRKPAANIYYATSSETLAGQVQHLLLQLGIQNSLRPVRSKKGYRMMYHVYVEGAQSQLQFLSHVGIAGERKRIVPQLLSALQAIHQNTNVDVIPKLAWKLIVEPAKETLGLGWRDVAEKINTSYCGSTLFKHGIGRERMMRLGVALENENIQNLGTSGIFWDRVVSVEPLGVEDVYDATVPGVHNFVANDIVIHNSLEQDSDVVLFIYREDKYRADPTNQGIAEIIIAKHRNGPVGSAKLFFNERTVSFTDLAKEDLEYQEPTQEISI